MQMQDNSEMWYGFLTQKYRMNTVSLRFVSAYLSYSNTLIFCLSMGSL
jgi:hypothetical protein